MTAPRLHNRAHRILLPLLAVVLPGLVSLAPVSAAAPQIWHVRTDGNDSACSGKVNAADPGTGAAPRPCAFKTPQNAVDAAGPGDSVLLHAGVYKTPGTTLLGRSTIFSLSLRDEFDSEPNRLLVRDAADGAVVFDGDGTLDTAVIISNTSYVTVQGIEMREFAAGMGSVNSWGAAGVKVESASSLTPSDFIILRSLSIHDATLDKPTGQFAEIAADCDSCNSIWIDTCTIDSLEPAAIVVGEPGGGLQTGAAVTGNRVTHARANHAWTGIRAERSTFGVLSRNFVEESSSPAPLSDLVNLLDCETWDVLENVLHGVSRSGLHLEDGVADADTFEQHFVLNNLVDCVGGTTSTGLLLEGCSSCQARNNLLVDCAFGAVVALGNIGSEYGFNGFFDDSLPYGVSGGFGFSFVGSDVTGDPLFTAQTPRPDPFYRLQPGSPMIDAGDDAYCSVVPSDGMCDIGPFQVSGSSTMAPATPSVLFVDTITGKSAVLHGSGFSDPDASSTHEASQWQVDLAGGNFNSPVADSGRTTQDLTTWKAGGLAATTSYQGRVRYQDDDLNWSAWSAAGPSFATLVSTAVPPKVTAVNPADGAKGVVSSISPILTFNTPVAAASVTTGTIQLLVDGVPVPQAAGSPMLDGTEQIVTILPAVLLTPDSKYKISVIGGSAGIVSRDSGIAGKSFKSSFKAEAAFVSSNPPDGASGVSTGVTPSLTFSWPMDPASATTATVTLTDLTSGGTVALTSVSVAGATVTLTPAAALAAGHKFRVDVVVGASGLRFADGRLLLKKVKVTFKT